MGPVGGSLYLKFHGCRNFFPYCFMTELSVDLDFPTHQMFRIEVAENNVGIGDRREFTTKPIACWARLGTGALWSH